MKSQDRETVKSIYNISKIHIRKVFLQTHSISFIISLQRIKHLQCMAALLLQSVAESNYKSCTNVCWRKPNQPIWQFDRMFRWQLNVARDYLPELIGNFRVN